MNTIIERTVNELLRSGEAPLPLSVIPDRMGINLCSVRSMVWERRPDGQLVNLTIKFEPVETKLDQEAWDAFVTAAEATNQIPPAT